MNKRKYIEKVNEYLTEIPMRESENTHAIRLALWEIQQNINVWVEAPEAELRYHLREWAKRHFYLHQSYST